MNLTKVIKDSISSNTIASIEKDSSDSSGKLVSLTISHIFITDNAWANTANVGYSKTETNYIKLMGKGFHPNGNVYLTVSDSVPFFDNTIQCNSYYVNYTEMRVSFLGSDPGVNYSLYLQNPDGQMSLKDGVINFVDTPNP